MSDEQGYYKTKSIFELNQIKLDCVFRLKNFLAAEQKEYEKEILNSSITPLERAAQLREKAKQFRLNKENENALFVQEKLDQKWRY